MRGGGDYADAADVGADGAQRTVTSHLTSRGADTAGR